MSLANIESALLNSYEQGGFALPNTEYENIEFQRPDPNTAWAKLFVLPNPPSVASLGANGQDEHDGVFQIDLNYPLNQGTLAINQKADACRNFYFAGRKLIFADQALTVTACAKSSGQFIDGWYRVILSIFWYTRTTRGN